MYNQLEAETRRMATKMIADVQPENAELVLNSIQADFMGGAIILVAMIIKKLYEKDYDRTDLLQELQQLHNDVQSHLLSGGH